jgi:O-succinylbenzoic acid--CoA ligase
MITLVDAELHPYALPLAQPMRTRSGWMTHRRGFLIALSDDEGRRGWGDAACWPGFGASEEEVAGRLGELCSCASLAGLRIADQHAVWAWLEGQALPREIAHALELALLDLVGQSSGRSIAELLAPEPAAWASTHALVLDAADTAASVLKLKIDGDLDLAESRVAEVRGAARPSARLRIDANGSLDEASACEAIARLARYGIEWIEQPLPAAELAATARVRAFAGTLGIKVALDESIATEADVEQAIACGAADVLVLKPMFIGGLGRTLKLIERARAAGYEAIVTNALESAIGRTGVVHLAAALPGVHGLGSALTRDLAEAPARRGDRIDCPRGSGLGVAPRDAARHATAQSGDAHSIPNPLASAAIGRPEHPALVTPERSMSYRELRDAVARTAGALAARGVAPGNIVALTGPRSASWIVAFHAIGWLGAAVAPLPHDAPDRERERYVEMLHPALTVDARELELGERPMVERSWPLDEMRAVLATSGTSGMPQPVALSTLQLLLSAFGSSIRLGHEPHDRWLACLPLHHVAGASILARCAFHATTVLLHERFDAAAVARSLDAGDATLISLVPTMLDEVLRARPGEPFPATLRAILLGGARPSSALLARARTIGAPVAVSWGMTEAASQIATRFAGDLRGAEDSGPPLPFARVESVQGRLVVHGPLVGGRLITADRGDIDALGRVQVAGRADSAIVSGGEKIDPKELEDVLEEHPSIAEAAVVGVPSARWGERPVAVLVPRGEETPELEELRAFCRARMSTFKAPDALVWCARLPKTDLGKIARARVRELALDVLSLDDHVRVQHIDQNGRRGSRREALERDEGMHQLGLGAHLAVDAQGVSEAHGSLRELVDHELDVDAVVQPQRPDEIGIRMHQRHAEALPLDERFDSSVDREHELLEGGVAVLGDPTEERDAGAIDLVKTNRHPVNERHGDERR